MPAASRGRARRRIVRRWAIVGAQIACLALVGLLGAACQRPPSPSAAKAGDASLPGDRDAFARAILDRMARSGVALPRTDLVGLGRRGQGHGRGHGAAGSVAATLARARLPDARRARPHRHGQAVGRPRTSLAGAGALGRGVRASRATGRTVPVRSAGVVALLRAAAEEGGAAARAERRGDAVGPWLAVLGSVAVDAGVCIGRGGRAVLATLPAAVRRWARAGGVAAADARPSARVGRRRCGGARGRPRGDDRDAPRRCGGGCSHRARRAARGQEDEAGEEAHTPC